MGDPGTVAGIEYRFQGRDESAWRHHHFNRLATLLVHVRLAVRYHKQLATVETSPDLHSKPIRSPHRFRRFPQAGLIFSRIAGLTKAFRQRDHFPCQGLEEVEIRHLLAR